MTAAARGVVVLGRVLRLVVRLVLIREMLHILLVLVVEHGRILVLVNVALRRLIWFLFKFQLRQPLGLSLCFFGSLFRLLLVSLDLSELFKDVLVVQEGVGELLLEDVSLQESGNSIFKEGLLKELMDRWSLVRVLVQHHGHQVGHLGREVAWKGVVLALADSDRELMKG